jgi:hypothetical protein
MEEQQSGPTSSTAWERLESIKAAVQHKFELTLLLIPIVIGCGVPSADVTTDYGIALPTFYALEDKTMFLMQLLILVVSTVSAAIMFIHDHSVLSQLRVQPGLKGALIVGIVLAFPLFPFSVLITAMVAWAKGSKQLLAQCAESLPIIIAGEVLEGVLSFVVQANAFFTVDDVEDIWISVVLSLLSVSKAAAMHSTREKVYWALRLRSVSSIGEDAEFSCITGPLKSLTSSVWRSLLILAHSILEVSSGVGCLVLFHTVAHDTFIMQPWGMLLWIGPFSYSWAVFSLLQITLALPIMASIGLVSGASLIVSAGLTPFFVPLPLLDGNIRVMPIYVVRAASQATVMAGVFMAGSFRLNSGNLLLLVHITAVTSLGMWLTLLLVRACGAISGVPEWHAEWADTAKQAILGFIEREEKEVDEQTMTVAQANHPQLKVMIDPLAGSGYMLSGAPDHSGSESEEESEEQLVLENNECEALSSWPYDRLLVVGMRSTVGLGGLRLTQFLAHPLNIRTLTIGDDNMLGAAGAKSLALLANIHALKIGDQNSLGEEGAKHVAQLAKLHTLEIGHGNSLGSEGAEHLARLAELHTLVIGDANSLGSEGAEHLARLAKLHTLEIGSSNSLGSEGAEHLARLAELHTLKIGMDNGLGSEGAEHLARLAKLHTLEIGSSNSLGSEGAKHLAQLAELHTLKIHSRNDLGSEGAKHLAQLAKLHTLWILESNYIGREGAEHLGRLAKLHTLWISEVGNDIGEDGDYCTEYWAHVPQVRVV